MSDAGTKLCRVAAYCRVSTDHTDQANSLASQGKYFRAYIEHNPCWQLTKIYVDEGITGTSTKKRAAFRQMINDAANHSFDLILTKEISRFARNSLDSIYYTRKLKELGIGVIFLNDNINTLDGDAELRLTIMSSIAQEESRKTSERVKWGQRRRMEQGVVFGRSMLGYDVKNGQMSINEAGAEVVRLIFHKFAEEGKGTHVIARELREAGFKSYNYLDEWSNTAILRILRNEKYAGDLVQKKTYTPNYLNHQKKYNRGEEDFVVLHNHHEPIISRELFDRAQVELACRRPKPEQLSRYSCRYCFSGKLRCGFCGSTLVSRTKKRCDGSVYKSWRCAQAARQGQARLDCQGNHIGCDGRQINNDDLMLVMAQTLKDLPIDKADMLARLLKIITTVYQKKEPGLIPADISLKIERLTIQKQNLIELYLNKDINKTEFNKLKQKYEAEIKNLKKEWHSQSKQEAAKEQSVLEQDIEATLRELMAGEIQDEAFWRSLLDKMVLFDRTRLDIYLAFAPCKYSYLLQRE